MNVRAVGTDVLPNVYIDRITLDNDEIMVTLKMYDHAEPNQSWRNRRIDPYQINTVCCLVADYTTSQELNNGTGLIFDYPESDILIQKIRECNEFTPVEELEDYYSYEKTITFPMLSGAEVLYVYAACYVDGFSFLEEDFQRIMGPLVGEKIMENGRLVTESGYFYTGNSNEEYGGPVHIDPSSVENGDLLYMEGSSHINGSHEYLYYVPQENFKIIDNRS